MLSAVGGLAPDAMDDGTIPVTASFSLALVFAATRPSVLRP